MEVEGGPAPNVTVRTLCCGVVGQGGCLVGGVKIGVNVRVFKLATDMRTF